MRRIIQTIIVVIFLSLITLMITTFLSLYMTIFSKKFDSRPPTTPTELNINGDTPETVLLNWKQSIDEKGGSGLKEYIIYSINDNVKTEVGRKEVDEYSFIQYTVENLTAKTKYEFQVSSIDNAGNESSLSNPVNAYTDPWNDHDKPTPPTNLSYFTTEEESTTETTAHIKWDPGYDETSGVWKYLVLDYSGNVLAETVGDELDVVIDVEKLEHYENPHSKFTIMIKTLDKEYPFEPGYDHESENSESFKIQLK